MPTSLAILLTVLGVAFLLDVDRRQGESRSPALWLPVMWLAITGSRFVSQWMDPYAAHSDYSEGSIVDAAYFGSLIVMAAWVLQRRAIRIGDVVRTNAWMAVFMGYGLVSVLWADFPEIAGKRWIKTLGHPLMALIILTDSDPGAAFRTVIKRCAVLLIPTSVFLIKYVPDLGRGFDAWSGAASNRGVGITKNDLGYVCMVTGTVLAWSLLTAGRFASARRRWTEIFFCGTFLAMIVWLLSLANSATSTATWVVALATLWMLGLPFVPKRYFGAFFAVVAVAATMIQLTMNPYDQVVALLGRDVNLTDRKFVWYDVIAMQDRPVLGFGFESFWLGDRLDQLAARWWWRPNQAHNGYIETYLNLGIVGVVLLGALIISTFMRIAAALVTDPEFARVRMAFLFAILMFNYTEAAFKAVHFVWTIFFIIAMEPPKRRIRDDPQLVVQQ